MIPYLVKFQGLLDDIFKYFRNSGKNSASLKAIQTIVYQTSNCKKFKEVFHTRWLSFDGVLQALLQNYSSLISLFLEESSGKALALHKPITSYKFLYVAHYLVDVMEHLSRLSRIYQKSDLDFTNVNPRSNNRDNKRAERIKDRFHFEEVSGCSSKYSKCR